MNHDDMARLLPADRDLPAARKQILKEHLMTELRRAARQPAPVVRDSDFTYIRSEVAYEVDSISDGHETSSMEPLHERQIWLPVANVCATGLLIEQGERTPISPFPVANGKVDRDRRRAPRCR